MPLPTSLATPRAGVVAALLCLVAALGPARADPARAIGSPVAHDPVSAGRLELVPAASAPAGEAARDAPADVAERDAIALDATLELDVRGLLAELRLTQRFRNDSAAWRDGRYAFPMPEGATLLGLEIRVGERTIRGAVMERAAADERFVAAAAEGRVAAVVDVHRPNLFETRVASIGPGEEVRVTLDVLLPVETADGRRSLVLPTTLTPRYANADVADAHALDSPVLPASLVRGPRVRLAARVAGREPGTISSPTHRLAVAAAGDAGGAPAARLEAPADRDVVLHWPGLASAGPGGELHAVTHSGTRYVQLLLEPPAAGTARDPGDDPRRGRELILVLDRSGSMAGEPIRAARAAVEAALDRLGPRDAFNVIAFDDGLDGAFDAAVPATPDAIDAARRFVRRLAADGGTEIRPALERAIRTSARIGTNDADGLDRLVQIVFVTDGAIGYEDALLADIERTIGTRRLFTVGIGSAPNRWFLERAATLGRGTSTFVTDAQGVEAGIGELLGALAEPVLTDLVASPSAGTMTLFPNPLPDLYAARPVMLVARIDDGVAEIVVTGRHRGRRWRRAFAVPAPDADGAVATGADPATTSVAAAPVPATASFWASRRVAHLLDAQRTAREPDAHRDEIVAVALEAGLATRYTSFVAVSETVARPAGTAAAATDVPNLAPAGTLLQPIAMPSGALGLPAARRLALLLAFAGGALLLGVAALGRAGERVRSA